MAATESYFMTIDDSSSSMSPFARRIYEQKYAMKDDTGKVIETWRGTAWRVASHVMAALGYDTDSLEFNKIYSFISDRKFIAGGRYLYAAGRPLHQVQNCVLLRAEDSREGWADITYKSTMALMTGAGIGIDYSLLREKGAKIKKTGGEASGPLSLMNMVNEIGRNVMQGGSRRSAIWAGLNWRHPDIFEFIKMKDWPEEIRQKKEEDFNYPAPMDMTNVSVLLDDAFFKAYEDEGDADHEWALRVYWETLAQMVVWAEPGFSIDTGWNSGETLRNACTEVTSYDDSDICNLGSINMARIDDIEQMEEVVKYGTLFLLAGTVYSHVPYEKIVDVRTKNRRLGLGIMGVHEWLLQRGYKYDPCDELGEWLDVYAQSGEIANRYADYHELSRPVKTRSIAPTGTIGIIAETTTGIEPIFCVSYKRRNLEGTRWVYEYVVDPTAKRLIDQGVDPSTIEDAYMLSLDVERRVRFQSWVQRWVDHGISSTINLPYPVTEEVEQRDFGKMLMDYLPSLRGITCYPDGSRGGQPLTVVPYEIAIQHEGVLFEESEERCVGGACGI